MKKKNQAPPKPLIEVPDDDVYLTDIALPDVLKPGTPQEKWKAKRKEWQWKGRAEFEQSPERQEYKAQKAREARDKARQEKELAQKIRESQA